MDNDANIIHSVMYNLQLPCELTECKIQRLNIQTLKLNYQRNPNVFVFEGVAAHDVIDEINNYIYYTNNIIILYHNLTEYILLNKLTIEDYIHNRKQYRLDDFTEFINCKSNYLCIKTTCLYDEYTSLLFTRRDGSILCNHQNSCKSLREFIMTDFKQYTVKICSDQNKCSLIYDIGQYNEEKFANYIPKGYYQGKCSEFECDCCNENYINPSITKKMCR
jgi:hypothetical protein